METVRTCPSSHEAKAVTTTTTQPTKLSLSLSASVRPYSGGGGVDTVRTCPSSYEAKAVTTTTTHHATSKRLSRSVRTVQQEDAVKMCPSSYEAKTVTSTTTHHATHKTSLSVRPYSSGGGDGQNLSIVARSKDCDFHHHATHKTLSRSVLTVQEEETVRACLSSHEAKTVTEGRPRRGESHGASWRERNC